MRGWPRAAAVLALSLSGCAGRSLLWRGHTPDRRVRVEIREAAGEQRAWVAGAPGPACRAIAVEALRFGPQGDRLAYPALLPEGWRVFEHRASDGWRGRELGPPHEGVAELRYAPAGGALAFAAERAGQWRVWRRAGAGEPVPAGPPADAVFHQTLRWSADGRRLAYAAEAGGRARAVVDGLPGAAHQAIGSLAFTGDGARAVYVAADGGQARVVIDGQPGPPADEIRHLAVGEREIAHGARRGAGWRVVSGGAEGPVFDEVGGPVIAADGRVGYPARVGSEWCAVVDGARGPRHDSVTGLVLGAGGRVGYLARRAGEAYAVIDGKEGPSYAWVGGLTFSRDGRRWAYLAQSGERTLVVRDDGVTPFDAVMDRSLVFHPDGGHWACLAGDRHTRQLFISIDGAARRPFDAAEWVDLKRSRPDEELIPGWVAAELALHLGEGGVP